MNPDVIIISRKDEPSLNHLCRALDDQKIECQTILYSRDELLELDTSDFKGFFIFCLPPKEIKTWLYNLEIKFLNHFKIYSYDSLVADNIDHSLFLMFDYMIAGEQEYNALIRHLQFLKYNYWKKIPITKLGLQSVPGSKIISKLFRLLEQIDINTTNLDQLAKKLHVSHNVLRREIRVHLNLQYTELKFALVKHYQEYFQENII